MRAGIENRKYIWGIFFIWPLASVLLALKNIRSPSVKNLFWAFFSFYGLTFAISDESSGDDIVRYVSQLKALYKISFHSVSEITQYFIQTGEIDLMRNFLAILVSRFTDSQSVLTLIYAFIFGFFYSRNIWYILSKAKGGLKIYSVIILIAIFCTIPIWQINGFRFWTAAQVFLYGLLPFLLEKKGKGILISALSLLFHFAFLGPILIILLFLIIGNLQRHSLNVAFLIFLCSFLVTNVDIELINNIFNSYLPTSYAEQTEGYRTLSVVEKYRERNLIQNEVVWYAKYYTLALKWTIIAFLLFFFLFYRRRIKLDFSLIRLFSFTLLFYALVNLLSSLPSGARYYSVVAPFGLTLIFLIYQNWNHDSLLKFLQFMSLPLLILFIIVSIRTALYSMSITTLIGNPVIAIFIANEHVSINNIIK